MINDFDITVSKDDFLRVLNKGFQESVYTFGDKFFGEGDFVADVRYSRSSKKYTLICKSGRRILIEEKRREREKAVEKASQPAAA